MSVEQAASAAVEVFPATTVQTSQGPLPLRVVMVAIAGAESGFNPNARGDYGLDPQFGLCDGYSSWSLWQIHNVHAAYLTAQSGSSAPCAWASWLSNPVNCARAALAVYSSQGLEAWTTYHTGAWVQYLSQAKTAVASAEAASSGAGKSAGTTKKPAAAPFPWLLVGVGAGTMLLGSVVVALQPELRAKAQDFLYRVL